MFGWLSKTFRGSKEELPKCLSDSMHSMTKAMAMYEIALEHLTNIEQKKEEYPAQDRKNRNIPEIWAYTRIEAFFPFLMSANSNLMLLADISKQREVLDVWFNQAPHLSFPHAVTENEAEETIKALFNVYINIAKIVERVGADEIGRGGAIFDSFSEKMKELKSQLDAEDRPTNLPLIFDLFYDDITKKTKIIALCTIFGTEYENMMRTLVQHVASSLKADGTPEEKIEQQMAVTRQKFSDLLASSDPDYLK